MSKTLRDFCIDMGLCERKLKIILYKSWGYMEKKKKTPLKIIVYKFGTIWTKHQRKFCINTGLYEQNTKDTLFTNIGLHERKIQKLLYKYGILWAKNKDNAS